MVVGQRRRAFPHYFSCDGLGRHLHCLHTTDEGLEPFVGERGLTPVQLYDPAGEDKELKTCRTQMMRPRSDRCGEWRADSLVQVIERVGDANCHLHSGLRGQLLNRCIALLPKGLGVVLVRQTGNLPFLEDKT